ncbi:DUF342 domain-containing protein [Noviherbaspirillum cavernae]|nr:FapA family protein [Noviherbaspirillum cavernae]
MEATNLQPLSLSLDQASGELRVRFNPAAGMPPPDRTGIRQELSSKGWGSFYFDDKAVIEFIGACRTAAEPLEMTIGARRDGEFALKVSEDMLTAWLTLVPACGGEAVTQSELSDALRAEGIVYGIRHDEIKAAFAAGQCERLAIACGEPVVEGEPTRFETLYDRAEDPPPAEDLDRIKYTDFCHILLVQTGDALMRRIPPVPGKNGTNIKGHPLLPQPTPNIAFLNDLKGAALDQKDPNLLIATSGGQPALAGNGVTVNPVIEVLDVDLGTGSIEFDGTLRVGGDVKAGLRIKVTGDVVVNGTVEAAEIVAGGNVAVRNGIVGHLDSRSGAQALPDTTTRIFCEGVVQALFMENAHIEAGKSIVIERSARQCELLAREEIVVGKEGRNGHIVGGSAQATNRIATGTLGTTTGIKTQLQVGLDPYLEKQIAEKDAEFKRRCDELDRVIKLMTFLKQNPKKGEGGIAEKAEATRRQLLAMIDTLTAELKSLRARLELAEQAQVEAAVAVCYGVEVRIAQQVWQAREDGGRTVIQLKGGKMAVSR